MKIRPLFVSTASLALSVSSCIAQVDDQGDDEAPAELPVAPEEASEPLGYNSCLDDCEVQFPMSGGCPFLDGPCQDRDANNALGLESCYANCHAQYANDSPCDDWAYWWEHLWECTFGS